jgi:hypothetical protein
MVVLPEGQSNSAHLVPGIDNSEHSYLKLFRHSLPSFRINITLNAAVDMSVSPRFNRVYVPLCRIDWPCDGPVPHSRDHTQVPKSSRLQTLILN